MDSFNVFDRFHAHVMQTFIEHRNMHENMMNSFIRHNYRNETHDFYNKRENIQLIDAKQRSRRSDERLQPP